jgi:hypothetical protein
MLAQPATTSIDASSDALIQRLIIARLRTALPSAPRIEEVRKKRGGIMLCIVTTRAIAGIGLAFALAGCGGGGGGGGGSSNTGNASPAWTAALEVPYQGARLASSGTSTTVCLKVHGGTTLSSAEIYHDGFLVDNFGGGSANATELSITSSLLGGLTYTGTISSGGQIVGGTYAQASPASSGSFSVARRSAQTSCNWPLLAGGVVDVDASSDVASVSMALDRNANPVLAWSEESSATGTRRAHVHVARHTPNGIERIGSALDLTNTGQAQVPAIAVSPVDGTIYVAWSESEGSDTAKLYVKAFSPASNAWALVGTGQLNSAPRAHRPQITVDLQGRPIVTWWEHDPSNALAPLKLYVRRWSSNAWQELGPLLGVNSQGANEDIDIDPSTGEPVVLWRDDFGDAYVSRWNGNAWQGFGNNSLNILSFPEPVSGTMRLAVRQNGNPIAAWQNQSAGVTRSTVAHWESATQQWAVYTTLDPGSEHVAPELSIASDDNAVVAYRSNGRIHVKKWDGSGWRQMGGPATPNLFRSAGVAIVLGSGDVPITALRHESTSNAAQQDLYLLKWEP